MSWTCEDCLHWNWNENSQASDGRIIGPHCGIFSSRCATDILNGKLPPSRFIDRGKYYEEHPDEHPAD